MGELQQRRIHHYGLARTSDAWRMNHESESQVIKKVGLGFYGRQIFGIPVRHRRMWSQFRKSCRSKTKMSTGVPHYAI